MAHQHPMAVHQGVVRLVNLCEFLTSVRVVRAGFTRSYRLCEENRFVLLATNENPPCPCFSNGLVCSGKQRILGGYIVGPSVYLSVQPEHTCEQKTRKQEKTVLFSTNTGETK